jgi:hypothetical protein
VHRPYSCFLPRPRERRRTPGCMGGTAPPWSTALPRFTKRMARLYDANWCRRARMRQKLIAPARQMGKGDQGSAFPVKNPTPMKYFESAYNPGPRTTCAYLFFSGAPEFGAFFHGYHVHPPPISALRTKAATSSGPVISPSKFRAARICWRTFPTFAEAPPCDMHVPL